MSRCAKADWLTSKPQKDLGAIAEAAEAASDAFEDTDIAGRFEPIEQRLESLESLLEDLGKRELAGAELAGYVQELREELKDLRSLRSVYGFLAVSLVGFLALILVALIFVSGSPLYTLPPYPAAVTVIALITGIVILTITLAKGVHRSSVDRGRDDTTVDAPQLITELFKQLRG